MTILARLLSLLLLGTWASLAAANSVEENLRALIATHAAATEAVPDLALRRLVKGTDPSASDGIFTEAYLETVPAIEGGPEWRCLAEALYFEARGESVKGQFAVAEVILNRVDSPRFPDTICRVVNQGSGNGRYKCQFSYTCDGKPEYINDKTAWANVGKVARLAMEMDKRPLTHGATFYHTNYVSPSWAKKFPRTASIGDHLFYKEPDRISSN